MNEEQKNRGIRILEAYKQQYPDQIKLFVPGPFSKRFNSLYSIRTDLEYLINAQTELSDITQAEQKGLIESNLQTVKTALWYSMVAIYGKCFTQNDAGKTKLDSSKCFKDRPDLLTIHDKLMRIRHGYISHRGDNEYDVSLVTLMYPISGVTDDNQAQVKVIGVREVWPRPDELTQYAELFLFLKEHVEHRLTLEGPRLREAFWEFFNTLTDEQKAFFIF